MRFIILFMFAALVSSVSGEDTPLPASAKSALDEYQKATEKITQDYNKAQTETRTKAIAGLSKAMESETKKGNLDGALAIKAKIEQLKNENSESTDLLGNTKGAPSAPQSAAAALFVSGCNGLEVRINGTKLLNANRDALTNASSTIKAGDIIAIRNGDRHDVNSNFLLATTADGVPLFWTTKAWISYLPPSLTEWHDVTDKKFISKPVEMSGPREYADMINRAAAGAPGWRKDMLPVSGVLMAEDKATYICYRITPQDLIPKPAK